MQSLTWAMSRLVAPGLAIPSLAGPRSDADRTWEHLAAPVRLPQAQRAAPQAPHLLHQAPPRLPSPLRSSSESDLVVTSEASPLGGALSTYGAPAEWWHDSVILGRLSALALRYFAGKAMKKPWQAWRHWVRGAREKSRFLLRSQVVLALRRWHRSLSLHRCVRLRGPQCATADA